MGILGKLLGQKGTERPAGDSIIKFDIQDKENPVGKELKKATEKKKQGDLDGAIKLLRTAYDFMGNNPEWFSPQHACRLPLYLAEAKQDKEAWSLFKEILDQSDRYTRSYVLDKMRLFLQRKGEKLEAVKLGIMAHLSDMENLTLQKSEGNTQVDPFKMQEEQIKKLLKKANRLDLVAKVSFVSDHHFSSLPRLDLSEVSKDMDKVLYN